MKLENVALRRSEGEPAAGTEGFGGDDARTSIFDYWSMPELVKWVDGGRFDGARLDQEQQELRVWYGKLIRLTREHAFTRGEFYGLNHANKENPAFGRLDGETVSGHWLYAYLRRDASSGQAFLVFANFHGTTTIRGARVRIPEHALGWLELGRETRLRFQDRLGNNWTFESDTGPLPGEGFPLPDLPPLQAMIIELRQMT